MNIFDTTFLNISTIFTEVVPLTIESSTKAILLSLNEKIFGLCFNLTDRFLTEIESSIKVLPV